MTQAWYVESEGEAFGPYSLEELRELERDGRVGPGVLLRAADDTVSYPFESLAYLFETAPPPPAPARVSAPRLGAAPPRGPGGASRPRGRTKEGEAPAPRAKPTSSLAPFSAVLALLGGLLAIGMALTPSWIEIQQDVVMPSRDVIVLEHHLDAQGYTRDILAPARPTEATRILVNEMRKDSGHVAFAGMPDDLVRNPLFDPTDRPGLRQAVQQTQLLSMVIPILGILGAIAAGVGGFVANGRGGVPSGLGAVGLLSGILLGICLAAYRFMGLGYYFAEHGGREVSILFRSGFLVGLAAGLCLIVAGILLLRANAEISKKRRLSQRRRPS